MATLKMTQRNELLKNLRKIEEFFNGTLKTCKTDSVDLKLKDDVKSICYQP